MDYFFFLFKQKTAYEMRISDWSSDVCSSDLHHFLDHADEDAVGAELVMVDAAAGEKGLGVGEAGRTGIVHFPPAGETEMMLAAVGEHAGEVFLVAVEDVDAELGDVLQRAVHGGGLVDADEQARRVPRQRRPGRGGYAHRPAVPPDRYHRDRGGHT